MMLNQLMIDILDNACSNPAPEEGYNLYLISTCCVDFLVTARKIDNEWEIKNVTAQAT